MTAMLQRLATLAIATVVAASTLLTSSVRAANPFVTDVFTADPAALVHDGTVYVYVGHDEAPPNTHYRMNEWLVYSSRDMVNWTAHGSPLSVADFGWAIRDAYAAHVAEKDGKFYFYVSIEHNASKRGKAIGVAVADSPTGPFRDARGSALITADMTNRGNHGWEDIDPAVFTDDDGTSYLFWGNVNCYYAKLKPNMIELDGPIMPVELPFFTEAPWIHKRGDLYYLTYATGFPEKTAYATATSIEGPWTWRGLLAEGAGNSNTIHQAIVEFNDQWYFFYHNGMLPGGDSYRRAVCVDYLHHNDDGTLRRVVQSTEGTSLPPVEGGPSLDYPLPTWSRLQPLGDPKRFVRHVNYQAVLAESPIGPMEDSMWNVVPGLSEERGVSFESLNFPNHYLSHENGSVVLRKNDGSDAFVSSATFLKEPGLADKAGTSFQIADTPNAYLQHDSSDLRVAPVSDASRAIQATFRLLEEGGYTSLPTTRTASE